MGVCSCVARAYMRLRLYPSVSVRNLPSKTPSGLSIGMILKTKLARSRMARGSSSRSKKARSPSTTCEAGVSPGCTRAVTRTYRLRGKRFGRAPPSGSRGSPRGASVAPTMPLWPEMVIIDSSALGAVREELSVVDAGGTAQGVGPCPLRRRVCQLGVKPPERARCKIAEPSAASCAAARFSPPAAR